MRAMPKTDVTREKQIGIRLTDAEDSEIRRRAAEANMTVTAYVIASALGDLKPASRLEKIERRLARLERASKEAQRMPGPDAANDGG